MDSLILINTTNAGRQGKYGLTHNRGNNVKLLTVIVNSTMTFCVYIIILYIMVCSNQAF